MAEDRAGDFAAAREAELAVELAGVVEAEHVLRLGGEVLFGFGDEFEGGVAFDDSLEGRDEVGLGLDELGSGAGVFLALLSEALGGFGDEEGGGEWGGEEGIRVGLGRG